MNTEQFWAKVDKTPGCWLWTGATTSRLGYGSLRYDGKHEYAHRLSLKLAGVDITGFQVDHICHEPRCVRPEHLRCATNKQNSENLTGAYANSTSGIRGVYWDKATKRWYATVGHNGKSYGKRFLRIEDAAEWARAKRVELFTHNDADRS